MRCIINIYKPFLFMVFFCIVMMNGLNAVAQQNISFSQYWLNPELYNPAVCGKDLKTEISLHSRKQWIEFQGAPQLHLLSFTTRIPGEHYRIQGMYGRKKDAMKSVPSNIGFGSFLYSEKNGPVRQTGLNTNYSYHIDMGEDRLSFGLSLQLFQFKVDGSDLIFSDEVTDPVLLDDNLNYWSLDAGFGVYWRRKDFFTGYSATHLFNSTARFGYDGDSRLKINRVHYLTGGYDFTISNELSLHPSLFLKMPEEYVSQLYFGLNGIYQEKFLFGVGYKTGSSMTFHGGMLWDRYKISYAYDYHFSDIMPNTFGSHEIFLSVVLSK